MPDNDLTEIVLILDRSGSMSSRITDVIGGVNTLVDEQRKKPGRANLSLYTFDTGVPDAVFFGQDIKTVPPLTQERYSARGSTALYDAIAHATDHVGKRLAETQDQLRPGKVVVVVYTDGEENASVEYTSARLKTKMDHQRDRYNWEYVFMGTNQDAVLSAKAIGIPTSAALSFANNAAAIGNSYASASSYVGNVRGLASKGVVASYSTSFSADDRAKAMVNDDADKVHGGGDS